MFQTASLSMKLTAILPRAILHRGISTSCTCYGKRNFRKFLLYNKRGSRAFKERQRTDPYPDMPIDKRGTRDTGLKEGKNFVSVPEMIPEIIVPSLNGFKLKPYVSYRVEKFVQRPFTPKDLFLAIYADKIKNDYKTGQLGPDGEPLNPSEEEKLTAEEAENRAARTGCDIFQVDNFPSTTPEQ